MRRLTVPEYERVSLSRMQEGEQSLRRTQPCFDGPDTPEWMCGPDEPTDAQLAAQQRAWDRSQAVAA
jgi:hypothetical protein